MHYVANIRQLEPSKNTGEKANTGLKRLYPSDLEFYVRTTK